MSFIRGHESTRLGGFHGSHADQLPKFAAGGDVPRLCRYAVEHKLQYIPCFCGCVRFGHKSNRDCYIKTCHQDGTLTFTSHAVT